MIKRFLYNFIKDIYAKPDIVVILTLHALILPFALLALSLIPPWSLIGMLGLLVVPFIQWLYMEGHLTPKDE